MPVAVPSLVHNQGRAGVPLLKVAPFHSIGPLPCQPIETLDSLIDTIGRYVPNCELDAGQVSGVGYLVLKNTVNPGDCPFVIDNYSRLDTEKPNLSTLSTGAFNNLRNTLIDQALALEGHCILLTRRPREEDNGELYFRVQLLGGRHVVVHIDDTTFSPLALRMSVAVIRLVHNFVVDVTTRVSPLPGQYDSAPKDLMGEQISALFGQVSEKLTDLFESVDEMYQEDEENLTAADLTDLAAITTEVYVKTMSDIRDLFDTFEPGQPPTAAKSNQSETDDETPTPTPTQAATFEQAESESDCPTVRADSPVDRGMPDHLQSDAAAVFACETCSKSFATQRGLNIHEGKVHKVKTIGTQSNQAPGSSSTATNVFKCDVAGCSKGFATLHGLKVHKGMMHKIASPQPLSTAAEGSSTNTNAGFKCDVAGCSKSFGTQHGLNVHKGMVHKGLPKPSIVPGTGSSSDAMSHKCNECDKGFKSAHGLAVHKGMMHKSPSGAGGRPASGASNRSGGASSERSASIMHACNQCIREFETAHGLAVHKGMMHRAETATRGSGSSSSSAATSRGGVSHHQVIESDTSVRCEICGQTCKNAHGLAVHKGMMHGGGGARTSNSGPARASSGGAQCNICGQTFKNAQGVAIHKGRMHKK